MAIMVCILTLNKSSKPMCLATTPRQQLGALDGTHLSLTVSPPSMFTQHLKMLMKARMCADGDQTTYYFSVAAILKNEAANVRWTCITALVRSIERFAVRVV